MKKMVILLTALAMIAGFSTIAIAASISGSAHDLSDDSVGSTELCIFCHVPHNPVAQGAGIPPLWNRDASTQTFTLYDGSTGSATGISGLCLSCHDGVTGLDAFGGGTGTATLDIDTVFAGTTANIGLDLQDDHPVMVTYPSDWATTGDFNDPAGLTGDSAVLFAGNVECASCHNPHDSAGGGGTKFLRTSNAASAMCLDCHAK